MSACTARGLAGGAALAVALSACSSPSAAPVASWHVVVSNLRPTLLSVWGTGPDDVFAVGGALGDGFPAVALHYDGKAWRDLAPGGNDTLWWANGTGANDVWMVGERGRIVHWDGAAFTAHAAPTTATLFGVWAAAPDDVWAVGGTPGGGTPSDVVLHYDGATWTPAPPPKALGVTFFKVWGSGRGNLYVVGEAGTVWHRSGGAWTLESMPPVAMGTLLTVNGCSADEVYAVGGRDVLSTDGGGSWARLDVSRSLVNDVNGVSCASPGQVALVGGGGLKERASAGEWTSDFAQDPHQDLHGVWADGAGAYWAVGGDFVSGPLDGGARAGVLAYYGSAPPGRDGLTGLGSSP